MSELIFKGSELSELEYEAIALDRVSGKLLASEPKLATTCWFDYRLMHPSQKTYLFAHYYDEAYRYMLRLHVDYEQAQGDNPRSAFPKNDPLGKTKTQLAKEAKGGKITPFRTTTSVWKARQKADELCIPYDVFCMSGMKAAVGRIWKRTPTPAQLYSQDILNAIIERWALLVSSKIYASSLSFYKLKEWIDHPSQIEHANWLAEQISCRVNPEMALAEYAFIKKLIPPQILRSSFTDDVILSASRISKRLL